MKPVKKAAGIFFIAALISVIAIYSVNSFEFPKWFPFSNQRSLDEWEDKILKGKVIYKVEEENSDSFLHAISRNAASAIFYRVKERFRAGDYPMLSWKWKVIKFPDKQKLRARQGIEKDDYAARVYVIFPSFIFLNSKALEYVWDEASPEGTINVSPYSGNIRLIVVHSGSNDAGKWVEEERDIVQDYQKAFGVKPSLKIGAIALMSDADNTEDVSESYFDDIRIGYAGATGK